MTHTAKHTPGTWIAALGERLNTDVYCTDAQGNRIFIAEFATQADAVLGAAAPAMYEALREAQELIRSLVAEEMIHSSELQRVGNCQANMWEALSQADGKQ